MPAINTDSPVSLRHALDSGLVWQAGQQPAIAHRTINSGYTMLNQQLPHGGWQAGQLCEIYSQGYGTGEMHILLPALATLSRQNRWIMMVAPPAIPYAPALAMAGINTQRLLMVHPKNTKEALWCIEEGLRSGHCSAVLGWLPETEKTAIRRLQLACEEQNNYCWLWPTNNDSDAASAAALRLHVYRRSASQAVLRFIKRRGLWPSEEFTVSLHSASLNAADLNVPPCVTAS